MTGILTQLTWGAVGLVVLLLVFYLGGVLIALYRAGSHLGELNELLESVATNTDPFSDNLSTVNGALSELRDGLSLINSELKAIVDLFSKS